MVAEETRAAARPRGPVRRSRWLTRGLPGLGIVLIVLVAAGFWAYRSSPWEHLSGANGTPPQPLNGVPPQGADRVRDATDPILVAGALVERHDGGAHAVNLSTGRTWWDISRPGRVHADSVGRVDGRHSAIVWSDHRLTVVDVPSGHRTHIHPPARSDASIDEDSAENAEFTVGLSGTSGRPLVAVVQSFGVDTYDVSSGRRLWSRSAPDHCVFSSADEQEQSGTFLSLDVGCEDDTGSYGKQAYSTLLDASSGRPLPHFDRFQYGSLTTVGDHEVLQEDIQGGVNLGYRVIDTRTGRVLWTVKGDLVHGGAGLVVVTDSRPGQIMAYQAADGRELWRRTFTGAGDVDVNGAAMVIGGQVRVVVGSPKPFKVITFDSAGKIEGTQDLPMFDSGGNPTVSGGDYRTLVVLDMTASLLDGPTMNHPQHIPPYVLLTATR